MLRILFFFLPVFFPILAQQKFGSTSSHQNSHSSVESLLPPSSFVHQRILQTDVNVAKSDIETFQDSPSYFDSPELDSLPTEGFELDGSILKSGSKDLQNHQLLDYVFQDVETDLPFFSSNSLEPFSGWSHRMLQLQAEISHSPGESLNIEFILENEMLEGILLETGEAEALFEEHFINEAENGENNEGLSEQGEVCVEGETILESQTNDLNIERQRLLAADININIDIHIDIESENNQEENVEQHPLVAPDINPGNQECEQVTICQYAISPRMGKKCLCRQQLSCS